MRIKKEVKALHFERADIMHTIYGSFIESVLSCNQKELTDGAYIRILKGCKFPFVEDKDLLRKTWDEFRGNALKLKVRDKEGKPFTPGTYDEYVYGKPLAAAVSGTNTLIVPFYREDGKAVLLSPNRNFYVPMTVMYSAEKETWKEIDWNDESRD